MSNSGKRIDYSLRLQKNIERKIFGDIVRSLSYFGPVDDYRYIGFGSYYYQDFMMFHKDFNIHKGVSIEIVSDSYVNRREVIDNVVDFLINKVAIIF